MRSLRFFILIFGARVWVGVLVCLVFYLYGDYDYKGKEVGFYCVLGFFAV